MARKPAAVEEDFDLEDDLDEEETEVETKAKAKSRKPKAAKPKEEKPKGIGARQVAERLGAEPKTFRAWLRRRVAAGDFADLTDREGKTRYNFGEAWTSPLVIEILEAWEADVHDRAESLAKAKAARAAKKAEEADEKAGKKPAPKRKKASS